jgi:hypothetical protein
LRARPKT